MRTPRRPARREPAWFGRLPPPGKLVVFYIVFILAGAVLLSLPIAHSDDVHPWQALFTAVSSVTVTGLAVVDTGSDFTPFGQMVILLLIQAGGLGLMVFAATLMSVLGVPLGMPQRQLLREDLRQAANAGLGRIARRVLKIAAIAELAGVIALSVVFVPDLGWSRGLWSALFHTVSAFNNAGFALYPDSLSGWVGDWRVNLVIPALFIVGGLGFVVVGDVWEKRAWEPLALHSKLMLAGTGVTLAVSFALFAALEWNNSGTLGPLAPGDRLWAAWFQAAATRTAGFNTVDITAIEDSTALLTMALMFVGAGPASTGGGIKITTAIVAALAVVAFFKRRERLHAFGRSMGPNQVMKAMALIALSATLIGIALFLLTLTWEGRFIALVFEAVSAFGTVGLSMGATAQLDVWGQAVIMALMFVGRVGPLTLGFFIATRAAPRVQYPRAEVFLG